MNTTSNYFVYAYISERSYPITSWKATHIYSYNKKYHVSVISHIVVGGLNLNRLLDADPTVYMATIAKTQVKQLRIMKIEKWIRKLLMDPMRNNIATTNNKLKAKARAFNSAGNPGPSTSAMEVEYDNNIETSRKIDKMVSTLRGIKSNMMVTNSISFRITMNALKRHIAHFTEVSLLLKTKVCIWAPAGIKLSAKKYIHNDEGKRFEYKTMLGIPHVINGNFEDVNVKEMGELLHLEDIAFEESGGKLYFTLERRPTVSADLCDVSNSEYETCVEELAGESASGSDSSSASSESESEEEDSSDHDEVDTPIGSTLTSRSYIITQFVNGKGVKLIASIYPFLIHDFIPLVDELLPDFPGAARNVEGVMAMMDTYKARYTNWRSHMNNMVPDLVRNFKRVLMARFERDDHETMMRYMAMITKGAKSDLTNVIYTKVVEHFDGRMRQDIQDYVRTRRPAARLSQSIFKYFKRDVSGDWYMNYTDDEGKYSRSDQARGEMRQAFLMYQRGSAYFPIAGRIGGIMYDQERIKSMSNKIREYLES